MRFWKDKQGNKLTAKEFMGRWRDGLDNITPVQKTKTQLTATRIQLVGIFLGLIVTIMAYKNLWWVAIILLGALINTGVQYLGLSQQMKNLKKHEEQCEEMTLDELMEDDIEEQLNEDGGKTC